MLDTKKVEINLEDAEEVTGGTGPLGTGPIDYPYKQNTLPPYDPKIGPLPPNTCDPPIKRA